MKKVIAVIRCLYALFYAAVGAAWFSHALFGTAWPEEKETPAAKALTTALTDSGLVDPLIASVCLGGGLLLLFRRTAPLGIAVLAPLVSGIFLFHLVLNDAWPWGSFHFACLVLLAWWHRAAFRPLWNYRGSGQEPSRHGPAA